MVHNARYPRWRLSRTEMAPKQQFTFITETGDEDKDMSKAKQRKVRQAVRLNLATRRNFRFMPANERSTPLAASDLEASNSIRELLHPRVPITGSSWRVTPSSPRDDYAAARIKYNFDLLNLSALCSVHMGLPAASALQFTHGRLANILQERNACYLDFVPGRYEQSALIRVVTDCVMAKASRVVCWNSDVKEATALSLFGKALRELQVALGDSERCTHPDVLCASLLLQLYEVSTSEATFVSIRCVYL
jgi:hypothetical protein